MCKEMNHYEKQRKLEQIRHYEGEIRWLECKKVEVKKQMEKKPSKLNHYMDLQRQIKERQEKIKYLRMEIK